MTSSFTTVLAAIDRGPMTGRVIFHGSALATVLGARLKIVHVAPAVSKEIHAAVVRTCLDAVPYMLAVDERDVIVATGEPAAAIIKEASLSPGTMIVAGTSDHGRLMRMLLGSTTDALLATTECALLLVPPTDIDIVSAGDGAALNCGPVIAAVDLAESNKAQVRVASELAAAAKDSLYLMTVAANGLSDHDAAAALRDRGHNLQPLKPTAMIVRRGNVAEEISRAAARESSGLVVMGLRDRGRGRPGVIAASVLHTGRAFVLAVPSTVRLS